MRISRRLQFERNWTPEPFSGCWLWTAAATIDGYGCFWFNNRLHRAHRVSWMIHVGDIPAKTMVLHKCDTPSCVNPAHLFLGNHSTNALDMVRKGRGLIGSKNGLSKLNEDQVRAIRCDPRTQRVIAEEYGLAYSTVAHIKLRQRWGHLAEKE